MLRASPSLAARTTGVIPVSYTHLDVYKRQSLHNEENLNQRFYSSYMMNRPLFPKGVIHRLMVRKTMCNEIDGLINSDICHVYLNASSCPVEFSFDSLKKILTEVADKGFSIYVTAVDSEDLDMAAGSLEDVYKRQVHLSRLMIDRTCKKCCYDKYYNYQSFNELHVLFRF